ncbi:MAG: sigma-70 family RNA polymerase sigma factor [Candidatus Dadabacteria bacterium]|nr:MAG: sigma-70 family RNA polymerase sigma factor [Candidatus Dadabacteria bacterium]
MARGRKKKVDEDRELVRDLRQGKANSYSELIEKYSEKVFSLAFRMTRNQEDAQEVLQDVFVTVFRKIKGFEGKSSFSSWLYRVTVNAALMKLRKNRQDKSLLLDDVICSDEEHTTLLKATEIYTADEVTLRRELAKIISDAIEKLPLEYRAVFVLRDVDGLTNREVADILSLTVPAVKSRLHRSRMMLRELLKDTYKEISGIEKELSEVSNL